MTRHLPLLLGWLGGSLTTAALLMTFLASADGDIRTPDVGTLVPYEGRLDKDGVAVDDDVELTFRLWDGTTIRWSERRTVSVVAGRFAVLLGDTSASSADALTTAFDGADALELEVVVHEVGGDVVLSGRKPLSVAPYALLAGAGLDVDLGGDLVVESERTVNAAGTDGSLLLSDGASARLAIDGDQLSSTGALQLNRVSKQAVSLGGSLTVERGELRFAANGSSDGGVIARHDALGGTLTINPGGNLGGGTLFDGNVWPVGDISGITAFSSQDNQGGDCTEYDLGLETGELTQYCANGRAVVGGRWGGNQTSTKGLQFMRCCPIAFTVE